MTNLERACRVYSTASNKDPDRVVRHPHLGRVKQWECKVKAMSKVLHSLNINPQAEYEDKLNDD